MFDSSAGRYSVRMVLTTQEEPVVIDSEEERHCF